MKHINRREKVSFIFSSQDPKVIAMENRIVRIVDGRIIQPEVTLRKERELDQEST
jgi:hypothetical protein